MTASALITPVILCGGAGTRLWPLSRRSHPKQFSSLLPGKTLFQRTASRVARPGYAAPLILTADAFRFIVSEELAEIGIEAARIVLEPEMRNTAPAVCMAAQIVAQEQPEALLLVLPSDHLIRDEPAFHRAVLAGVPHAKAGHLVAFGVAPTRTETGFGYLELPGRMAGGPQPFLSFIEKPDRQRLETMAVKGHYVWNAGIFLLRACDAQAAFSTHAPEIVAACEKALSQGYEDLGYFRPGERAFSENPSISFDHAIMERIGGGFAVPLDCGWSDLGTWKAVWQESPRDAQQTAVSGAARSIASRDSLLYAPEDGPSLVGLGLDGIMAVVTRDAVLVAPMARSSDLQHAIGTLKAEEARLVDESPRVHRPWGWYEVLTHGPHFKVKRIMVRAGGRLSLQSHAHRAEHWVVVAGSARVTIGDAVHDLGADQTCYVPQGERHRLENPGSQELHLIEVQSGSYLGEDDIVRYDDVYAR